jgi:dipeptidyl aminopeptidase/acylaminoacyl peptidase
VLEPYAALKKKPISKTEVVSWKGALDETVEGILYYPQDYQAGKK